MTLKLSSNSSKAVNWLKERPSAHRGLHDEAKGIYENTLSAAAAAMRRDYPIELDLQPSKEMVPMVFHDEELERMTGHKANIRDLSASELSNLRIKNTKDQIPTLKQLLELVDGDVALIIELKGKLGADDGFAQAVVDLMRDYDGPFALMSFEHHLVEELRTLAPEMIIGLTAYGEDESYITHKEIAEKIDADFTSYYLKHLETRFVKEFRATGRPVICWTVKTPEEAKYSEKFADQITFEGFQP